MLGYVAFIIGYRFGWSAAFLCGDGPFVGRLCGSCGRSGQRCEAAGGIASRDCFSELLGGHDGRRQAFVPGGGHTCGAGVPCLPSAGAFAVGGGFGHLEGSQSMGHYITSFLFGNFSKFDFYRGLGREEVKIHSGGGAGRRHGVLLRAGGCKECLLWKVHRADGGITGGIRGPLNRATVGIVEKGGTEAGHLCGLRSVGALLSKAHESGEVSILSSSRRWNLLEQDGGRSELFQALASFVQGAEICIANARPGELKQLGGLGVLGGEAELSSSIMLAPHCGGGRPSSRRTSESHSHEDQAGDRQGWPTPTGLDGSEALECGLATSFGRQDLLDRASDGACYHLGCQRREGCPKDTAGGAGWRSASGWCGCAEAGLRERRELVRRKLGEEEPQQDQERSEEEKASDGKRGAEASSWKRERKGRWERWRSKGFWRWKILGKFIRGLLRLEQREWFVWKLGPRRKMPGENTERTSMHDLWLTWASQQKLFVKELKVTMVAWLCWSGKVKVMVGGSSSVAETEGKLVMKSTDKVDHRGMSFERHSTKRKKFTGEDPPGDGDPPRKAIHVEGSFLTIEEYFERRTFTFLHHFSGKRDYLSEAITEEANNRGIKVNTCSCDKVGTGDDLAATFPFGHHVVSAGRGEVDGYHSGFPCHTYSRLLWRQAAGMPGPVRSKDEPYGLEGLPAHRREVCDVGTILMARSVLMAHVILEHDVDAKVPSFVTVENPPPSDVPQHLSAWHMPEMVDLLEKVPTWRTAIYNTCAFEDEVPLGEKHYKPGMIGGTLPGILTMGKRCKCNGKTHEPIVGKNKSEKAATYPPAFCKAYAKLAVDHFVKMGTMEFLEGRHKIMEANLEFLRMKAADLEAQTMRARSNTVELENTEGFKRWESYRQGLAKGGVEQGANQASTASASSAGLVWQGGPGKYGMLKEPKKKDEVPKALVYVGGLRNPHRAVQNLPTVQSLGLRLRGAWDRFAKDNPGVCKVAELYGTKDCELDEGLVRRWKEELKRLFGAKGEPSIRLTPKGGYVSPIDHQLLLAWQQRAGDPEVHVPAWLQHGAPLGIEEAIETCGIFPELEPGEETNPGMEKDNDLMLAAVDLKNYKSVEDDLEGAELELSRYEKERYMRRVPEEEAEGLAKGGTVSRLGMVVKEKESGEIKRRIVIDLRRSGGNFKSKLPEKLILPRLVDFIKGLKDLRKEGAKVEQMSGGYGVELSLIDIHDAFTVFPVSHKELCHTLSPSTRPKELLMFQALLFGYKVAPLLYSRFAAMLGRLLQSGVPGGSGVSQIYLDDTVWAFQGDLQERTSSLAFVLNTVAALGGRIALGKGSRSHQVTWVGVQLTMVDADNLVVGLPVKFIKDLMKVLEGWCKGYAPLKELRTVAGKLSWMGGVLPRCRWTTSVCYAVLTQELREGDEGEARRSSRSRPGLFAVKRLEMARRWLLGYLQLALVRPMRKVYLGPRQPTEIVLTTDASPEALGAMLVLNGRPVAAMFSLVEDEDASQLLFDKGQSSSQAVLEILAVLVALKHWAGKFFSARMQLQLQSDSTAALAWSQKLSGSSPGINFLGSELGLVLEELGVEELQPVHVPGKANTECDFLSRPSTWKDVPMPAALRSLSIEPSAGRGSEFFKLPTPRDCPDLWGSKEGAAQGSHWDAAT